jgi:hypothetical protein
MPRRSRNPISRNTTLPMNGMRQPQASTSAGDMDAPMTSAVADPRMNPSVVPAAVELLMSPRMSGEDNSVV